MEKRRKSRFALYLALSLLFHAGLIALLYFKNPLPKKTELSRQEVVFVESEDILNTPLEIADVPKPDVEKVPDKARFASPYNVNVPEETVAPKVPKNAKLAAEKSGGQDSKDSLGKAKKASPKKQAKKPEKKSPKTKATPSEEKNTQIASREPAKDLDLKRSDLDLGRGEEEDSEAAFGKSGSASSKGKGGSDQFVHDYFPGIKVGSKTYLNTHAMPDVQYFTRMKRVFRLRFNPTDALRRHFQYNRIVVAKVNVTLAVEVSNSGQLKKAFVIKSSGISNYDREALLTVRQSAPFSQPPRKFLDKDGVLRMAWHFTTYL